MKDGISNAVGIFILVGLLSNAHAVCDAELEDSIGLREKITRTLYSDPNYAREHSGPSYMSVEESTTKIRDAHRVQISKINSNQYGYSVSVLKDRVSYYEKYINSLINSKDEQDRVRIPADCNARCTNELKQYLVPSRLADVKLELCVYKYALAVLSGSKPQNASSARSSPTMNSTIKNTDQSSAGQSNPLQQQTQERQQRAEQMQAKAEVEAAKRGKRTHDPAAEAHNCLVPDFKSTTGGFRNTCNFDVMYGYCVINPRKGEFTSRASYDCDQDMSQKPQAGGQLVKANGFDNNFTRGGQGVAFFACKHPASALDLIYVKGKGIQGRCRVY